jgi:hypothetical protein
MWLFAETDLEAASVAKHGAAGYAKKVAARQKREANKRKRDESAAVAKEKTPRVRISAAEIDGSRRLPPLLQKVTSSPMTAPAASRVEIHSQVNL